MNTRSDNIRVASGRGFGPRSHEPSWMCILLISFAACGESLCEEITGKVPIILPDLAIGLSTQIGLVGESWRLRGYSWPKIKSDAKKDRCVAQQAHTGLSSARRILDATLRWSRNKQSRELSSSLSGLERVPLVFESGDTSRKVG